MSEGNFFLIVLPLLIIFFLIIRGSIWLIIGNDYSSADDHESYEIPAPPPPPPYSLAPPVPTMSVRPMYNSHLSDEDSDDSYTERYDNRNNFKFFMQ